MKFPKENKGPKTSQGQGSSGVIEHEKKKLNGP